MSTNFLKKLQNFIFQERLLEQGDKVLIGISGGPDSIGLVLALKKLQLKYKLKLQLIHINYHQRGKDSEKDQKFVENFAKKNKLELKVFDFKNKKNNSEEVLRDFRYEKFEIARKDLKFDKIAVAHHLNDQVETFLMNMLRGSGLLGLSGMSAKRNCLIRPFLKFRKEEIENFLEDNNQKFRVDKTNFKSEFTRNKIRLELIPFLEKKFNLKTKEVLGKLISNLKDENELGDFWVDQACFDLIQKKDGKISGDILSFREVPIGGQKRLFRKIILELKGDLKNITNNNFLEFKKILDSPKNKKHIMKFAGIILEKDKKNVTFNGTASEHGFATKI